MSEDCDHEHHTITGTIHCLCGAFIELTVEIEVGAIGSVERAVTCDNCLDSHWFTVTVKPEGGDRR